MAAATAPGPRGESGGSAASALSTERIQSLTDLADLEAAYSRLCEEEVCGGAGRPGRRRVLRPAGASLSLLPDPSQGDATRAQPSPGGAASAGLACPKRGQPPGSGSSGRGRSLWVG